MKDVTVSQMMIDNALELEVIEALLAEPKFPVTVARPSPQIETPDLDRLLERFEHLPKLPPWADAFIRLRRYTQDSMIIWR